jgi:hypothetical protein
MTKASTSRKRKMQSGDAAGSDASGQELDMLRAGNHIRIEVDLGDVVDEAHRFVTQSWPRGYPAAVLDDLASNRNRFVPIQVLEYMVLDGVSKRGDVAPFVDYCFADWGIRHVEPARSNRGSRDATSVPVTQPAPTRDTYLRNLR